MNEQRCLERSRNMFSTLVIRLSSTFKQGFPGVANGKKSACNAGDVGAILGLGRSSGVGNGTSLQFSCLENSKDREAW